MPRNWPGIALRKMDAARGAHNWERVRAHKCRGAATQPLFLARNSIFDSTRIEIRINLKKPGRRRIKRFSTKKF